MQERMKNIVSIFPDVLPAMLALNKAASKSDFPRETAYLVHLRASQINGCSFCVDMHARELMEAGVKVEKIFAVGAWRESPYFTEQERAALTLTEYLTRISDRPDPVPDEIWNEVIKHFDESSMASLIVNIAQINVWNRFNAATRQTAGVRW